MKTTNTALAIDYFQKKADVQELGKKIQAKSAEAEELEKRIGALKDDINVLQGKLNNANKDMHFGTLSHDEFLQFKRDMVEKTEELNGLIEALAEKKEAIAIFQSNLSRIRQPIGFIRQKIASALVDKFATEVVELAS